ncbi:MAG TPA: hypothetical protein VFO62_11915 [Candidatus Binatia bacterium]|nr:hypothetical protein [Candidatus Binatia bacterium]
MRAFGRLTAVALATIPFGLPANAGDLVLPFGDEFAISADPAASHYDPAIAMTPDGRFSVAWWGDQGSVSIDRRVYLVFARRFSPLGDPSGESFPCNNLEGEVQMDPALVYLSDGSLAVTWSAYPKTPEDSPHTVYARVFDSNDEPVTAALQVNPSRFGTAFDPTIAALPESSFVVVWTSHEPLSTEYVAHDFGLYGQRFSLAGRRLGNVLRVNTTIAGDQSSAEIASRPDGGFVVTWASTRWITPDWRATIAAQLFDSSAKKIGTELLVGDEDVGKRRLPTVSSGSDGGFVVAWGAGDYDAEFENPGARDAVLRRFAPDGTPFSDVERVHADPAGRQVAPVVAHTGDEGFVVVWSDGYGRPWEDYPARDGSGFGLFGRTFDDAGVPSDVEFPVNTTTHWNQTFGGGPTRAVAADSEGNFVVVWMSDFTGIVGRRFCRFASEAAACGDADCLGAGPTATDALVLLQAAVGARQCQPCVCDVDESGVINARDALRVLRASTASGDALACPSCGSL